MAHKYDKLMVDIASDLVEQDDFYLEQRFESIVAIHEKKSKFKNAISSIKKKIVEMDTVYECASSTESRLTWKKRLDAERTLLDKLNKKFKL